MIDSNERSKRSTCAIELIDEADSRNAVLVSLTPNSFRLRLNTGDTIKHRNRAVKHASEALNFHREVDVARSVDNIDSMIDTVSFPETGRRGAGNSDTALLLLLHPVHRRRALVHFADLVRDARVIEDTFGRSGLAGIDVSHDADIPELV